jgi:hypothetical protein
MDKQLQELKRKYLQNPGCTDTAGRYISALERAIGGVQAAKKAPKRPGWECPDPDDRSVDGDRYCTKHDRWDSRCAPTEDDPCDYTYIGPGGLTGSPDGVCVYPDDVVVSSNIAFAENPGSIQLQHYVRLLINGDWVNYPVPAAAKEEYWESCIFCGQPEERK